ncbi:zinc knuckle CX2CX4HX4C containing protein [Tanacetum coccineum]
MGKELGDKKKKKKNKEPQSLPRGLRSRTINEDHKETTGESSDESVHVDLGGENIHDEHSQNNDHNDVNNVNIHSVQDEEVVVQSFEAWNTFEAELVNQKSSLVSDHSMPSMGTNSGKKKGDVEYYDGGVFVKEPNEGKQLKNTIDENLMKKSFVNVVNGEKAFKETQFRELVHTHQLNEGIDVEHTMESVLEATERYDNTLYGYFIGKRVAFPIVENYTLNMWKKFGLQKCMMNTKGFFFFKFASNYDVLDVIEKRPWIIRSIPIILNKWSPNVSLTKEDLTNVPVWVKLKDVPLVGFTHDGLSAIATKVGKLIMLDSYTSSMCMESWGRPSYARAMVEIFAMNDLKETNTVATPSVILNEKTSKKSQVNEDNFQQVGRKQNCYLAIVSHRNFDARKNEGIPVGKSKQRWVYQPKTQKVGAVKVMDNQGNKEHTRGSQQDGASSSKSQTHTTLTYNRFGTLDSLCDGFHTEEQLDTRNQKENEDIQPNDGETATFMATGKGNTGASTPDRNVYND